MKRRTHSGRGVIGELPTYGCDLEHRPESYWDDPASIYANIKGTWRRKQIAEWQEGDPAGPVPAPLFADSLKEPLRKFTGSLHPSLMGGEYLPDYSKGEIEIARVELASVTADVISVRAYRRADGTIGYRVVDEYPESGSYFLKRKRRTSLPLTLREVIELIETAELVKDDGDIACFCDGVEARGLVRPVWADQVSRCGESSEKATDFCRVTSCFYGELDDWYGAFAQAWIEESRIEQQRAQEAADIVANEKARAFARLYGPLSEHVWRAAWDRRPASGPLGGMAIMSRKQKIDEYAKSYTDQHGRLPEGEHRVGSLEVIFKSCNWRRRVHKSEQARRELSPER